MARLLTVIESVSPLAEFVCRAKRLSERPHLLLRPGIALKPGEVFRPGPGRPRDYSLGLPQIRICGTKNSSCHTSSIHLASAYNRFFGTSPVGRVVPRPSPEWSTRRTIMRQSRTTVVPPAPIKLARRLVPRSFGST